MNAARYDAVITAIHSIPLFAGFFEKYVRRYESFVEAMAASVARICDEEFRAWRGRRRREVQGRLLWVRFRYHC